MLLHISTDRIIFITGGQRIILPYGELEKYLPEFLYSHLPAVAGLPDMSGRITVLNGPGSFTNLRIATLALNTYNMLHDFALDFVSVGKIEWYSSQFVMHNSQLRRYCVMYIGQKKNFWVVDLEKVHSAQLIVHSENGIVKLHVDDLKGYLNTIGDDWFVDEMVAEGKEMMDTIFGEEQYKMYSFMEHYHLGIMNYEGKTVKILEPNYMIEANIDT